MIRIGENNNAIEVAFEEYPNGETRVLRDAVLKAITFSPQKLVVTFRWDSDADLIKLYFVKRILDERARTPFTLNARYVLRITYMPYSRMDRPSTKFGFTLKYVADFINSLDFDEVVVVEPHSDVTLGVLDRAMPEYIAVKMFEEAATLVNFQRGRDAIVFPDAGAAHRYNLTGEQIIVGSKRRNFDTGRIEGLTLSRDEELVWGEQAIIIDDLCAYGGTFTLAATQLREMGFKRIYLIVAHAEPAIASGQVFDLLDGVFTSDSIFRYKDVNDKLTILYHC